MKRENLICEKSFDFGVRIVNLYNYLCSKKREYTLAKQLLRAGTNIGANVKEGVEGQSKRDFLAKMNIALKEASETEYWIELLLETNYLSIKEGNSILKDCVEVKRILHSIVKSTKNSIEK